MKRTTLLLGVIVLVSLVSCEKSSLDLSTDRYSNSHENSFVSYETVENYARLSGAATKGSQLDFSVEVVVGADADTLMYIINYEGGAGWKIVSADNRTPAIIAEGESGSFSVDDGSPALSLWFDGVVANMCQIRHSSNTELAFSESTIQANVSSWNQYSVDKVAPPIIPGDRGNWFAHTSTTVVIDEEVDHMVAKWDQGSPYNTYCPYKSDGSGERAYTGCVAVSGAQILYFLHNKIGIPSQMVSEGYCTGDIHNYSSSFGNPTSTIWSSMSPNCANYYGSADAEALMMGYVGSVINMHYHNEYSWALPRNIKDELLPIFGLRCDRDNYDPDVVKQCLSNEMPVIVSASDMYIPVDFDIHCFVIDGYRRTHNEYTTHHYWVPENGEPDSDPNHPSYYTYSSSDSEISVIKINWGWRSQWSETNPLNDGWYALTDEWLTSFGGNSSDTWDRHRVMLYNFASVNE